MKHISFIFIGLPVRVSLVDVDTVMAARGHIQSLAAVRTQTAPVIDGIIDEPCWSEANVATNFTDYRTENLAVEQTFVRVLYDDYNLYIAFECLEPHPERIIAVERKYDQPLYEEDGVEIRFDTFGDRRSAYVFGVNTLGTRYDARIGLFDYRDDDIWGCDWSAACSVADDRWFAEIAIPIGNILFERKDSTTWGANFRRRERGIQESSYWCYRNSQARSPREFGLLTNLDLAKAKFDNSPAFETYVSGTSDFQQNSNKLSTGLDISMRLNSNMISAFTINPDFGQVEADPDTIELRDTERFLKERRTFFREGSELFKTVNAFLNIDVFENDNRETILRDFYEGAGVTFQNEVELWYTRSDRYHAPYQNRFDRIRIEYNEEVDIWDSVSAGVEKGVYEEKPYKEYFVEKPMRITDRKVTTLNANYRLQQENGDEDIWLWRSVTQYSFVWDGNVKFTAEQTSEDRHNLTLLFSWPVKKNVDFYVLLNDYETDTEDIQAAFVKLVYRF